MDRKLYAVVISIIVLGHLYVMCSAAMSEKTNFKINYSVYYEDAIVINITEDSKKFNELNHSVMNYLENIAYRMERYTGRGILERELNGTEYLVMTFEKPLLIQTKPGLNPDIPEGWLMEADKIIIKLGENVLGEERIFIYQDGEISDWSSVVSVDTIRDTIRDLVN